MGTSKLYTKSHIIILLCTTGSCKCHYDNYIIICMLANLVGGGDLQEVIIGCIATWVSRNYTRGAFFKLHIKSLSECVCACVPAKLAEAQSLVHSNKQGSYGRKLHPWDNTEQVSKGEVHAGGSQVLVLC
jgi:hypothetical protein